MSKMTVSRIIDDVSCIISNMQIIVSSFLLITLRKSTLCINNIYCLNFLVSCNVLMVRSLRKDEHLSVNRKCFHSINVHGVCDADLNFTIILAKWPRCLVCKQISHPCVLTNHALCSWIPSNILTRYYLRPHLVSFMLRSYSHTQDPT